MTSASGATGVDSATASKPGPVTTQPKTYSNLGRGSWMSPGTKDAHMVLNQRILGDNMDWKFLCPPQKTLITSYTSSVLSVTKSILQEKGLPSVGRTQQAFVMSSILVPPSIPNRITCHSSSVLHIQWSLPQVTVHSMSLWT